MMAPVFCGFLSAAIHRLASLVFDREHGIVEIVDERHLGGGEHALHDRRSHGHRFAINHDQVVAAVLQHGSKTAHRLAQEEDRLARCTTRLIDELEELAIEKRRDLEIDSLRGQVRNVLRDAVTAAGALVRNR